ncbi:hypothetical protein [Paenibacillus hamazuiensis]|uniref:hypothetical protein n=1 Tax=Paenibacillus hamazuiensis TaxID=2936508 RepID=UPI00200D69DF|nr:hypothetical protein [Paenibacillus hamazuiensis]
MVQRISASHLHELTDQQKEKLRTQWAPEEGEYIAIGDHEEMIYYLNGVEKHKSLPLLTVGQMIAYLTEHEAGFCMQRDSEEWVVRMSAMEEREEELCDALWNVMKIVL